MAKKPISTYSVRDGTPSHISLNRRGRRGSDTATLGAVSKAFFVGRGGDESDPVVWACYVNPGSGERWYVLTYDGERMFFGLIAGAEVRLGEFDRLELEAIGAYLDPEWQPKPLSVVQQLCLCFHSRNPRTR